MRLVQAHLSWVCVAAGNEESKSEPVAVDEFFMKILRGEHAHPAGDDGPMELLKHLREDDLRLIEIGCRQLCYATEKFATRFSCPPSYLHKVRELVSDSRDRAPPMNMRGHIAAPFAGGQHHQTQRPV